MTQMLRLAPLMAALVAVACSNPEETKRRAFDSGNAFFEARKYNEAIVEYRNALQQDQQFGEARLRLGEALAATGDRAGALRQFIRAADLMPENTKAQMQASFYLLLAGKPEEARVRLQALVDREPGNVDAQVMLGNALLGQDDLEGAVREIEEAIRLDPNSAAAYGELAKIRLREGNRDLARAAYEKAAAVDPKSVSAWVALGQFQASIGDRTAAEASFKRALAVDARHPLVNRVLAAYYLASKRVAEAEPHFKTLAEVGGPGNVLQLADYYIATQRPDDAKNVLGPLSKDPASSAAADVRLAAIAYGQKDAVTAHRIVDAVIARDAASIQALLLKTEFLTIEKKYTDALARAETAIKLEPRSVEAHFRRGVIQDGLGQRKEAIASFAEVLRLNPRATVAQLALSRLTLAEGTPDAAVGFAEGALRDLPGSPTARLALVRGLLARRDLDRAEAELKPLLDQFPKVAIVQAMHGALRLQRRDIPGARAAYERGLALDDRSIESMSGLVAVDLVEGRLPQARARVESRLALDPDRPELLMVAGQVYSAQRDFGKAETVLRRAVQVAPASAPAYTMLTNVLLASGKLDAARAEFDQLAQRDAKNVWARTMAAMVVHNQNRTEDAKKRYLEILSVDPRAPVAANNLAWIYVEEDGNLDDALRLAKIAVEQMESGEAAAAAQDTLGMVYLKRDLPTLAVEAFEKSVEQFPGNPSYHLNLARALSKAGEEARARAALQQALKLKPDFEEARALLASLKG